MNLRSLGKGRTARHLSQSKTFQTLAVLSAGYILVWGLHDMFEFTRVLFRVSGEIESSDLPAPVKAIFSGWSFGREFLHIFWSFFCLFGLPSLVSSVFLLEKTRLIPKGILTHRRTGMCLIVLIPLNVLTLQMEHTGPAPSLAEKITHLLLLSWPTFLLLLKPSWWRYGVVVFIVWLGSFLAGGIVFQFLFAGSEGDNFFQIFLMFIAGLASILLGSYLWICERATSAPLPADPT